MAFAAYFTGWENGFQNTLISITFLVFYSEYVGRYMKIPYINAIPVCMGEMGVYLVTYVITCYFPAPYHFPKQVTFWLQISLGVIIFALVTFFLRMLITLSVRYEESLSMKADHDQLTGLPNRYHVWDQISGREREHGLEGYWIAMLDIDDFKKINDRHGHNAGDYVLRELASILKQSTEGRDLIVSRWGGEEFLLCGRTPEGLTDGERLMEEIRRKVMEHVFHYGSLALRLTITVGIAGYHDGVNIRGWIEEADRNLYRGKTGGKNCVISGDSRP